MLGLPANRGIMKAHGMPHLLRHLKGELCRDDAIALGQRDTRNYAKRQLTWLSRYDRIMALDPKSELSLLDQALQRIG
jgi:tRNA A37 N6-isopentenylltransferase MiaA